MRSTTTRRGERGAALLEAVVALTIMSAVGVGAGALVSQSLRSVHAAVAREAEMTAAARVMAAIWLWPEADLDRHLGESVQGAYRVRIQRPERGLYTVEIVDAASSAPLLRTVLFRDPHA